MTEKIFDSIAYFKQLAAECRTCRDYNFVATECSGPDSIQGVMQQFRNDMADREAKLNICRYIF